MINTGIKTIRFSQEYCKLININHERPVMLLEVFVKNKKDLHGEFILYDTHYMDSQGEANFYNLPNGELLILLFGDYLGNVFTTVRNRFNKNGDKLDYYLKSRGEKFKVVFEIQE